jgi:DNA-binding transcriptional LysR family regulator
MSGDAGDRLGWRLRLRDLQTLRAVADAGSMARAAGQIGLTQSAISKIIAELESEFGVSLLERNARGVELTPSGRALLARSRVMLDELKQAVGDIRHINDPASGEIRIGTTEPMTSIVADIVHRRAQTHPRIRYSVAISDTTTLVEQLRSRELDVVLTRWVGPLVTDDLVGEALFSTPLAVMAARTHRLVGQHGLDLEQLGEELWTLSPPDSFLGRLVGGLFERRGLPLPVAAVTSLSIYMRLNLLAGGRFLSVLPMTTLRHRTNRSWLAALDIDLSDSSGPIALLTIRGRRDSGALALLRETARIVGREIS